MHAPESDGLVLHVYDHGDRGRYDCRHIFMLAQRHLTGLEQSKPKRAAELFTKLVGTKRNLRHLERYGLLIPDEEFLFSRRDSRPRINESPRS